VDAARLARERRRQEPAYRQVRPKCEDLTRSDLLFLPYLYPSLWPFPGRGCSTFARQSGPSRPGWPARPARPLPMAIHSVTPGEKAQVEGSPLTRPQETTGCRAGARSLRVGGCHAWIASQVHARSIADTCQIHRAPQPGAATADVAGSAGRSQVQQAGAWSALGTRPGLGKSWDVLR
jgi:hypothetical protein